MAESPEPIDLRDRPDPLGDKSSDPKPVSTALQVALLLGALTLVLLIAGVPGLEPVAGNGTRALRQDWAAHWSADWSARSAADTSVDRDGPNR